MKTTCKECRRFKRCMESSRMYPCKDFKRKVASDAISTDCKDYPDCKGCPIDASGGCDK